jgi:hypothetical protein
MRKLLFTLPLAGIVCSANAQLSGHAEVISNSNTTKNKTYGVGGSLQYLFYGSQKFMYGINAGFIYDLGTEEGTTSFSVPLMATARYYVVGIHGCRGGAYTDVNAGAGFYQGKVTSNEVTTTNSQWLPQAAVGIGYRSPMSYDYSIRIGGVYNEEKISRFIGFKFGYTF